MGLTKTQRLRTQRRWNVTDEEIANLKTGKCWCGVPKSDFDKGRRIYCSIAHANDWHERTIYWSNLREEFLDEHGRFCDECEINEEKQEIINEKLKDDFYKKIMTKFTNHLTPQLMFADGGFEDWLVRLEPFHNDKHQEPMSANQFYWGAREQLGSALRISELLKLIKADFDLDHRILTIRSPKSNKSGIQKTTIMPYDIKGLERFLEPFDDAERVFPTTRSTMWRYYKNASILGGLPLFYAKEQVDIEGAFTHLMRSSCSIMYEDAGAKHSIVQRKMRHSFKDVTDRYTRADLNAVLDFDDEHFREIPYRNGVAQ